MKTIATLALAAVLIAGHTASAQQSVILKDAVLTGTLNVNSSNENIPPSKTALTKKSLLDTFGYPDVTPATTAYFATYTVISGGQRTDIQLRDKSGTPSYGTILSTETTTATTVPLSSSKTSLAGPTDELGGLLTGSYYGLSKTTSPGKKSLLAYKFTFVGAGSVNSQSATLIGTFSGNADVTHLGD